MLKGFLQNTFDMVFLDLQDVFTKLSQEHYLSFSPRLSELESNTPSDWLIIWFTQLKVKIKTKVP